MLCDSLDLIDAALRNGGGGEGARNIEPVCSSCRTVIPPIATVIVAPDGKLLCFRDAFRIAQKESPLIRQQELHDIHTRGESHRQGMFNPFYIKENGHE